MLRRTAAARAERTGDLAHDLAVFVGLLRALGIGASTGSTLHAAAALTHIGLDRRADVRDALRCCLTGDLSDRARYDVAFDAFWSADDTVPFVVETDTAGGPGDDGASSGGGGSEQDDRADSADRGDDRAERAGLATYSTAPGRGGPPSARRRRDVDQLCRRLARILGTARGRGRRPDERGDLVDVRASMRRNLRHGDELVRLERTSPCRVHPRLVVFCDVSSSMRPHSGLFLAFVHSLTRHVRRLEAAVFDVETVVVTDVFRRTDLQRSMAWLEHQDVGRSGGTRIGHCLHSFLDAVDGRGGWRADTLTLVLSDGWDVGEPDLLRDGMRRLRERSSRIVWCDPHAAAAGYDPQVRGLRVALPYVDDHVDFSSTAALSRLVDRLDRGGLRPSSPPHLERTTR